MTHADSANRHWTDRRDPGASESVCDQPLCESLFRILFEASSDGILILDPETLRFVDCNQAALDMSHGGTKEWLVSRPATELSAARQPDGRASVDALREIVTLTLRHGPQRFEWMARRLTGEEFPVEVVLTPIQVNERRLLMCVSREITERKRIEEEVLRLNQTLERRVHERTIELVHANEQLKAEIAERRRREKVQQATYRISEAVHTAEDLDSLYVQIHETIKGLMPASNFYLALEEETGSGLHYYAYHVDEVDKRPAPRRMEQGLNGYVLQTGKALLADRASMTNPANPWHMQSGTPAAIWLGVPLTLRGKRTIGVMAVQDYRNPNAYGEAEKQILTFIAEQIALAIDRKRSEQALRESEEKHRALFEATSQGVMLHDEEKFIEVNPAVLRILGFKDATEILGKHPADTSAPVQPGGESAAVLSRKHIEECFRTGTARFDWLCRNTRGELVPIEVILTRVQLGGRQIIQAVINDIRERKAAEEALKQRHREVVTLLNSLPGYVFFKDAQGRYLMANQNFCNAVGCPTDQIAGKTDFDLFPRDLAEKYRADDAKVLASGETVFIGPELMVECGCSITVETRKVPLKGDDGEVVGLIGLGFDVTERKRAEEELLKALAREKQLGQLKSNFVSMVSHEFRTPLGIILSSAEILDDYFDRIDPEDRRDHLRSIQKNSLRMSELMEEVLLLGQIEAGKLDFQPADVDLSAFSERAVRELESVNDHQCPIEMKISPEIGAARTDERLLRHIFGNLVSNAVKYSAPGSPVRFELARSGRDLICTVSDQGIGIPEADQPTVFQAFQRGRNVGSRPGTGLGLMIVKRCVELHGGTIQFFSKVGVGTTFVVRLPVFAGSGAAHPVIQEHQP